MSSARETSQAVMRFNVTTDAHAANDVAAWFAGLGVVFACDFACKPVSLRAHQSWSAAMRFRQQRGRVVGRGEGSSTSRGDSRLLRWDITFFYCHV